VKNLIEKLVSATGPDRELDIEIGKLVHPDREWHREIVRWGVDAYTASLDAALALIAPDPIYSDWSVERDDDLYRASIHAPHGTRRWDYGSTPAIAVCVAALTGLVREGGT